MILRIRRSPPFSLLGLALNWLLLLLLHCRTPLALLFSCRSWGRRHENILFLNNRRGNHNFNLLFSFLGTYTPLFVIFRPLILFRFFSSLPHRFGLGRHFCTHTPLPFFPWSLVSGVDSLESIKGVSGLFECEWRSWLIFISISSENRSDRSSRSCFLHERPISIIEFKCFSNFILPLELFFFLFLNDSMSTSFSSRRALALAKHFSLKF